MSSSERVLSLPVPQADAVTLLAAPQRHHDAATRAALDEARAEARVAGHAEGLAQGRAELAAAADAIAGALDAGVAELRAELAAQHAGLAEALERRVLAAVRAVLDREPDDAGRGLIDAVHRVVADLDAPALEVRVAPCRLELASRSLRDVAGVEVVADPALEAHDARVLAPTVDVDLRRERLLVELASLLEAGTPLGELDLRGGSEDG